MCASSWSRASIGAPFATSQPAIRAPGRVGAGGRRAARLRPRQHGVERAAERRRRRCPGGERQPSSGVATTAVSGVLFEYSSSCESSERSAVRRPVIAYATRRRRHVGAARRASLPVIVDVVDEQPRRRIGVQPIEVDERDAHHRERAIVQRRLRRRRAGRRRGTDRRRSTRAPAGAPPTSALRGVGERVELAYAEHARRDRAARCRPTRARSAGRGNPLPSSVSVTAIAPGTSAAARCRLYASASAMLANPPSVVPSVVVKCDSQSCAVVELAMNICAWKPSMSLEPRYVPALARPRRRRRLPGCPTCASWRASKTLSTAAFLPVVHDLQVVQHPQPLLPRRDQPSAPGVMVIDPARRGPAGAASWSRTRSRRRPTEPVERRDCRRS